MAEWWEAAPLATGGGTPAATGSWWESAPLAPPETSFWQRFSGEKTGVPLIPSATADQASILPIRKTPQGPEFDYQAGALGSLLRAISTTGDVLLGNVPTPYGGSNASAQPTPDVIQRASDTAGLMTPINPAVRAGDFAIPGMAKNFQSTAVPPSAQAIKDTANAGFNAVRDSGIDVHSSAIADTARGALDTIRNRFTPEDAKSTYAQLDAMTNPVRGTTPISDLLSRHDALTAIVNKGGPDGIAARHARDGIENLLDNLSSSNTRTAAGVAPTMAPEEVSGVLQTARQNWRAAQNANRLSGELDPATTGILERAEGRAAASNSGQNLDNQLRMRAAAILERNKEVASLAPDERAALEAIRDGTFTRNTLRQVGNTLGGGGGLGRLWSSGVGGAAGLLAGGPVGAAVGTIAAPVAGATAKMLANRLASGSVTAADELIRSNSPLFQGLLADAPTYVPGLGRDAAVLRALLGGGLLAPPPQKVPGFI